MWMNIVIASVLGIILHQVHGKYDTLKICVPGDSSIKATHTAKYCDLLARSKKTQVLCVFGYDRLDCLRKVSEKSADFTVLQAEDLLFASQCSTCSILVVSEIRSLQSNPYEHKAVVVVRNGVTNLRGSKLCHPGWASDGDQLYLQFLEDRLAPQTCLGNISIQEDRIQSTSDFFQSACKAGPWSPDKEETEKLKRTYPSLCELCDNRSFCSKGDKYWGPGGAALCLQEGIGNVLWAKYSDVRIQFRLGSGAATENIKNFSFLCENGTTMPLSNYVSPCFWIARPWPVIVTSGKNSLDVQKILGLLQRSNNSEWEESLVTLLEVYMQTIINLDTVQTPTDYLNTIPGYLSASEMTQMNCVPHRVVRWCTTSRSEQNKCSWIARGALSYAIQPRIECMERSNIYECFEEVRQHEADMIVVPPDYQGIAAIQYSLNVLMYEKSKSVRDFYGVTALVKRDSNIKRVSDLKNSRVCFTMEGGAAWRSVLLRLGECKERVTDMFSSVCVARKENSTHVAACCGDKYSDQDADSAAFRCLLKDGCDVAFIKSSLFNSIIDGNNTDPWAEHLRSDDFRVICASDKSTECFWTSSSPNAVMVSSTMPRLKMEEAEHVLQLLQQYFVKSTKADNPMMNMFAPFAGERNVIFRDTSIGFNLPQNVRNIPHFLTDIINKTKTCSNAPRSSSFTHILILCISLFVLIKC